MQTASPGRAVNQMMANANPVKGACFATLLPFLFVLYSRVFDIKFSTLHIPGICLAAVIAASFIGGAFFTAFSSRIGVGLLLFTVWLAIDIPFSIWRGGSFQLVVESWPKALMVFVAVAGLTSTLEQCKRVMSWIAFAIAVLAFTSLLMGDSSQGRLLASSDSKFSNPNDLAQALLMGLPFWVFVARNPSRTPFRRIVALPFIGLVLFVLAKTGSRGGFIAFFVLLLMVIWNASLIDKIKLITVGAVLFVSVVLFLPKNLLKRYVTITNTDSVAFDQPDFGTDNRLEVIATESAASRMALLKESVRMTLTHPFFGAGPGMFPVAAAERAHTLGIHTAWLETHNSYTQISSECGLPALLFYLVALLTSVSRTTSIYRQFRNRMEPRSAEIAAMAFAIRASLIAFAVTAFFASVAYLSLFPCLAGLSAAFLLVVKRDFEKLRLAQAPQPDRLAPNRPPLPVRGGPSRQLAPAVIGSRRNWTR